MPSKRLVLVFPRFKYPSGDFSLGLAYLASYLRKSVKDIEISIIDTSFKPSLTYVRAELKRIRPDIVGIYSDTLMIKDGLRIAKTAKIMGFNVVVGGPHPTIMPDQVIREHDVDAICIGEGELSMAEYIEAFYSKKGFNGIRGMWYKKEKKIIKNLPREPVPDLDIIPMPAFDLIDMKIYMDNFVQLDSLNPNWKGISIIMSRGCPFMCSYCQSTLKKIFGLKVRTHSPEYVIRQIKHLKKMYGIDAFYFTDDTLTVFKDWLKRFCSLYKKERIMIPWACNTRADTVDYEKLKMMKEAGCVKLKVGIESINDRIRNGIYKKNISQKQIKDLLRWGRKLNVQIAGFFMLGAPTETSKEIWKTIWFAANSSLVEANFSITTPLPETGLYDYVKTHGWNVPDDYSKYDYYTVSRPQMSKKEVSVKALNFYKKFAYLFFYLHPRRVFITLRSMASRHGIIKAVNKLKRF